MDIEIAEDDGRAIDDASKAMGKEEYCNRREKDVLVHRIGARRSMIEQGTVCGEMEVVQFIREHIEKGVISRRQVTAEHCLAVGDSIYNEQIYLRDEEIPIRFVLERERDATVPNIETKEKHKARIKTLSFSLIELFIPPPSDVVRSTVFHSAEPHLLASIHWQEVRDNLRYKEGDGERRK